jgi:hypothetical protein
MFTNYSKDSLSNKQSAKENECGLFRLNRGSFSPSGFGTVIQLQMLHLGREDRMILERTEIDGT